MEASGDIVEVCNWQIFNEHVQNIWDLLLFLIYQWLDDTNIVMSLYTLSGGGYNGNE